LTVARAAVEEEVASSQLLREVVDAGLQSWLNGRGKNQEGSNSDFRF